MGFAASILTALERAAFGRTNPLASIPAIVYAAGFIGATEEAASGYTRVAVANDTTSFPATSPLVNGIAINFPYSSGYGAWTSVRFYDAISGGNEVGRSNAFAALVAGANVVHIPSGSLTISVT